MSQGDAIFLCNRTGVAAQPWAEAGYRCWCVDVQHPMRGRVDGNVHYVYGDARSWYPPREVARIAFFFAEPPCTDVAVSGARHFQAKGLRKLTDALDLFNACLQAAEWSRAPYAIENPIGVLSSHVRRPDVIFQPWEYGENYTKATCLWTGGGFVMPGASKVARVPCGREGAAMTRSMSEAGDYCLALGSRLGRPARRGGSPSSLRRYAATGASPARFTSASCSSVVRGSRTWMDNGIGFFLWRPGIPGTVTQGSVARKRRSVVRNHSQFLTGING